jgi:hypothetical protein
MEIHSQSAETVGTPHSLVCRSFSGLTDCASLHIKTDAFGVRYSLYEAPRELADEELNRLGTYPLKQRASLDVRDRCGRIQWSISSCRGIL